MSGDQVKEKLKPLGISINEIGRRLGMSSSDICQKLDAKDIKSGLLERICEAVGKDMTFFYPSSESIQVTTNVRRQNAHNITNGTGSINEGNSSVIDKLLDQNAQLIELLKAKEGV